MRFPRASGVLLHPTSLPGPHGSGDLGPAAFDFVDWLHTADQSLWQVLPLGGIGSGDSPYMSPSAFAGNLLLIDLAELERRGWLPAASLAAPPFAADTRQIDFGRMVPWRLQRLAQAAAQFAASASAADRASFADFCAREADWLDDYALFMALSEARAGTDWSSWPAGLARRDAASLAAARQQHAQAIAFWQFCQWCFARQWAALRTYAHAKGVKIIGDAPIFLAHHSADVWAHQGLFKLDAQGQPTVVAGVPPDYFSLSGQRWGNPLYRWPAHAAEGYAWWISRVRHLLSMVDLVRIDHFRGFADYWEIPADEPTAVNGHWRTGPGMDLFDALAASLGPLSLLAEDLGDLSPAAEDLLAASGLPGMAVLQFAFGGKADQPYLPHNLRPHSVIYTGTHDNNTCVGWWADLGDAERARVRAYLDTDGSDIAWSMLRAASASVADLAMHPMQDILALPGECRMNLPGSPSGWWRWRFDWSQLQAQHADSLAGLTRLFGRAPVSRPLDPI